MVAHRVRRHRGAFWAAVLLSVLALGGGTAVAYQAYRSTAGPDGAVRGYLAALADSDAPAALAFGDLPAGPHTLLTDAVLREQQRIAPIRRVQVVSVDQAGNQAQVAVRYRLEFATGVQIVNDTVAVHRRGHAWRLDRTAVATDLHLAQAADRATVLGAAVPDGTVLAFPGAVPIRFDTPYLQLVPQSASVSFARPNAGQGRVEVSEAGRKAVGAALEKALRGCLAAGKAADPVCPLPSDRFVPGSLSGRITGSAAGSMNLDVEDAAAGAIEITGSVPFTGSYRELTFDNLDVHKQGTLQLPLASAAYPVSPIVIRWKAGT
ncbi:hypothetical protein M6B22_10935 [Jatrophihabitans cynanchi]|uniref:DUF4878 domain-containing protein n=1 Tax=Jatrophihabitans cynanchi TaxID=2944128 RepID=A0ABY7K3I8_9ACTN|nr:hypothetical protein [Jatrophihabitans sp. SB3-54]WAX59254.1 hypothetical protein M6B22_10935 [Jatrophihabitans sp. SB3-54]